MAIIMIKGCIEDINGLMGRKGLNKNCTMCDGLYTVITISYVVWCNC